MPISPWVVGQTHPTWYIPFTVDEGGAVDLTGAAVTLWIFTRAGGSVQGVGTLNVLAPATNGIVTYQPAAADCSKAGDFFVALKAVYPDGSVLWQQPAQEWKITTLP